LASIKQAVPLELLMIKTKLQINSKTIEKISKYITKTNKIA